MNDQNNTTEVTETPTTVYLSEETKQEWVKQYDERQTFPLINKKPYVPCSVTGKLVIMGANNLRTRVIKFGGPMNLLNNFVCREQVKKESLKIQQIVKDTNNLRKSVTTSERAAKRDAKLATVALKQEERRAKREAAKAAKVKGLVDEVTKVIDVIEVTEVTEEPLVLDPPTGGCLVP